MGRVIYPIYEMENNVISDIEWQYMIIILYH